jgi:hypothetical protein
VNCACEMFGSFQFSLYERLVNHDLGGDIREFRSLSRFALLAHGFEVPLHPVHTNRDAVD